MVAGGGPLFAPEPSHNSLHLCACETVMCDSGSRYSKGVGRCLKDRFSSFYVSRDLSDAYGSRQWVSLTTVKEGQQEEIVMPHDCLDWERKPP